MQQSKNQHENGQERVHFAEVCIQEKLRVKLRRRNNQNQIERNKRINTVFPPSQLCLAEKVFSCWKIKQKENKRNAS